MTTGGFFFSLIISSPEKANINYHNFRCLQYSYSRSLQDTCSHIICVRRLKDCFNYTLMLS